MIRFTMSLLFAVLLAISAVCQDFQWLPEGSYNPEIPSPKKFLGYELGDYLTDNHQMVDYIHELEKKSGGRVKVFQYGETYERRKLWILAISSAENISNLEKIRTTVARLKDPRKTSPAEAKRIAETAVPISWMNFANDGGETAAFEAGLILSYQLAAGTDALTKKILDETVTIINPAFNPDSHQAFVAWAKNSTIRGGTADPYANEHFVEWFASSDGNHFKIDINRDGFALTQIESILGAKILNHWNPQIWIDNHGEPNEYYMAPFTAPVNQNYPESIEKWANVIGRNSAKYFDEYGWTYVKDESYDLFFPGYWDTYPSYNGAVAATYETNGGGSKGFVWEKPDGSVVTFREAIHKHFIADMATLEVMADQKQGMLLDFYNFFKTGMDDVAKEPYKAYVINEQDDYGRAADLVDTLLKHEIEVYVAKSEISSSRSETYFDRNAKARKFPIGSFVVPLRQPKKRLIKTLFEPDTKMEPSFLKFVKERMDRDAKLGTDVDKEGPGFYDITAWALPLHYDVETVFTAEEIPGSKLERIAQKPRTTGMASGKPTFAYGFSNTHNAGTRLAAKLLQKGYKVSITLLPTEVRDRELDKGTYLVRVKRNEDTLHKDIRKYAREAGTQIFPINTSWGENGGISLGSNYIRDLKQPRIIVATKEPTRAVTFGSVYSVLDQRFDLDFTAIRTSMLARANIGRYNVIVLPDGNPRGYLNALGKGGVARLKNWIKEGGTLVALKGGAEFTTLEGVELTDVKMVTKQADSEKPIERIPGSLFKATVNNDYHLALGYRPEIAVMFRGSSHMTPTKRGANVVTYKKDGFINGHIWDSTVENLGGKLYMADVPMGRGNVVLFADDPTFRAYWNGLDRLFIGSIIMNAK